MMRKYDLCFRLCNDLPIHCPSKSYCHWTHPSRFAVVILYLVSVTIVPKLITRRFCATTANTIYPDQKHLFLWTLMVDNAALVSWLDLFLLSCGGWECGFDKTVNTESENMTFFLLRKSWPVTLPRDSVRKLLGSQHSVKKDRVQNEKIVLKSATTHEYSHRFRKTWKAFWSMVTSLVRLKNSFRAVNQLVFCFLKTYKRFAT